MFLRISAIILTLLLLISASGFTEPENPAVTSEVRNAGHVIGNGIYVPDSFSWSGGSGRLKGIECPEVRIEDNEAIAKVVILSGKYSYIRVGDTRFNCDRTADTSTAWIPVKLNTNTFMYACTTAMSAPHEIEYEIYVGLDAAVENIALETVELAGIRFKPVADAGTDLFRIFRCDEKGSALIWIRDSGYYYICSDEKNIPEGMEEAANVTVISNGSVYLALPELIKHSANLPIEKIGMVSELPVDEGFAESIRNGSILVVGTPNEADLKTLLVGGCKLALVPNDTAPETCDYLKMLGITVIKDRSGEEPDEVSVAKWHSVYEIILGIREA